LKFNTENNTGHWRSGDRILWLVGGYRIGVVNAWAIFQFAGKRKRLRIRIWGYAKLQEKSL